MSEPKTRRTIWVEDDLWAAFSRLADARGESVSSEVRRLMRDEASKGHQDYGTVLVPVETVMTHEQAVEIGKRANRAWKQSER